MTAAALASSIEYVEDGVTLAFAAPFRFIEPAHLQVRRISTAGVVTLLTQGADWSATGGATDAGGTVTLVASVAGSRLLISRATPRSQTRDYTTGDTFPAESHEGALDKLTLIDQEQDGQIAEIEARALMVPEGAVAPAVDLAGLSEGDLLQYRSGALRRFDHAPFAGKYFAGDAGGKPVPASGTGNDAALRADLADDTGATLVGVDGGGSVQDKLDALEAALAVDTVNEAYVNIAEGATGFDGAADDTPEFQAAIDTLTALPLPGGTAWLGKRRARLNGQVNLKRSVVLDLKTAQVDAYVGSGNAVFAFGKGTTGTSNQIGGAGIKNLRLFLQDAGSTGIWVENAGGNVIEDVSVDLRAANQVGLRIKATQSPNGPYYGNVSNLALRGTGLSTQTGLLLEGLPVQGSITVNRWLFDSVRDCASMGVGLDIRGADGLVMTGMNVESCSVAGIRFGEGNRSYTGTAAGTSTASRIDDAGLAAIDLDQSATLEVLTGPNAGLSARIQYYTSSFVALSTPMPEAFTAGNSYRIVESKARSIEIEQVTFEQGTPSDASVVFTAGSGSCVVKPKMFTQIGGNIFRRQIEDLSNWVGRNRTVVWVPFTINLGTDGATGSKIITPGYDGSVTNLGGFALPFGGYLDAVIIQASRPAAYAGTVTATTKIDGVDVPAALRPVLTEKGHYRAIRVRKTLTNSDLFSGYVPLHVQLAWDSLAVGVVGQAGLVLVEF